jgi:hypothetical protein
MSCGEVQLNHHYDEFEEGCLQTRSFFSRNLPLCKENCSFKKLPLLHQFYVCPFRRTIFSRAIQMAMEK